MAEASRYLVHGYYTDEPQVVVDCIDAVSDEDASAKVKHARGGSTSGYVSDGAELLEDAIDTLKDLKQRPAADVAAGIKSIAEQYSHYHEYKTCPGHFIATSELCTECGKTVDEHDEDEQ